MSKFEQFMKHLKAELDILEELGCHPSAGDTSTATHSPVKRELQRRMYGAKSTVLYYGNRLADIHPELDDILTDVRDSAVQLSEALDSRISDLTAESSYMSDVLTWNSMIFKACGDIHEKKFGERYDPDVTKPEIQSRRNANVTKSAVTAKRKRLFG